MKQADFNDRMKSIYKSQTEVAYKNLLKMKFPEIIDVTFNDDNILSVEFPEGSQVTPEEVDKYLQQAIADLKFVTDNNPNGK